MSSAQKSKLEMDEWRAGLVKGDRVKVAREKDRVWIVVSIDEDRYKLVVRDESNKLPNIHPKMKSIKPII